MHSQIEAQKICTVPQVLLQDCILRVGMGDAIGLEVLYSKSRPTHHQRRWRVSLLTCLNAIAVASGIEQLMVETVDVMTRDYLSSGGEWSTVMLCRVCVDDFGVSKFREPQYQSMYVPMGKGTRNKPFIHTI